MNLSCKASLKKAQYLGGLRKTMAGHMGKCMTMVGYVNCCPAAEMEPLNTSKNVESQQLDMCFCQESHVGL